MYSETNNRLFTDYGCLNQDTIKRLINGDINPDEKLLIDDHLATCEMCRDATEGLGNISSDRYGSSLLNISVKLKRSNYRKRTYRKPVVALMNQPNVFVYLSIAFCFVLMLYFLPFYLEKEHQRQHLEVQKILSDKKAIRSIHLQLNNQLILSEIDDYRDDPHFSFSFRCTILPDGNIIHIISELQDDSNFNLLDWIADKQINLDVRKKSYLVRVKVLAKYGEIQKVDVEFVER